MSKPTGRPPGRPKGAVSVKRKLAHEIIAALEKELGRTCHPLEGLLRIATDEAQPVELRANCYRDALPYVLPRLQQQMIGVTGALEVENRASVEINMTTLLKDPKLADAAQTLAMALCEEEVAAIEAGRGPQPKLLEAEFTD